MTQKALIKIGSSYSLATAAAAVLNAYAYGPTGHKFGYIARQLLEGKPKLPIQC